jgi:hypothetical protein
MQPVNRRDQIIQEHNTRYWRRGRTRYWMSGLQATVEVGGLIALAALVGVLTSSRRVAAAVFVVGLAVLVVRSFVQTDRDLDEYYANLEAAFEDAEREERDSR